MTKTEKEEVEKDGEKKQMRERCIEFSNLVASRIGLNECCPKKIRNGIVLKNY